MLNNKNSDDLTEAEIRRLLSGKLRSANPRRLEHFRRSGRLVKLVSDPDPSSLEAVFTTQIENAGENERPRSWRTRIQATDKLLLLIEVIAIVGFVYLVVNGFGLHHKLNREVGLAFQMPTLTPTPLIASLVLPSGHVHPSSVRGAQPNSNEEIPKHLRPLVQAQANIPIPTPAPEHGVRIRIPAIDVDAPIVHGDESEQLKQGVAHHADTANPGQKGNLVLSGHNDIFGEVFRYLDQLKAGDKVIVYTSQRSYTYIVTGWELVKPTQVEVMAPTPDASITLISCHPYLVDKHRIVVKGNLA